MVHGRPNKAKKLGSPSPPNAAVGFFPKKNCLISVGKFICVTASIIPCHWSVLPLAVGSARVCVIRRSVILNIIAGCEAANMAKAQTPKPIPATMFCRNRGGVCRTL